MDQLLGPGTAQVLQLLVKRNQGKPSLGLTDRHQAQVPGGREGTLAQGSHLLIIYML